MLLSPHRDLLTPCACGCPSPISYRFPALLHDFFCSGYLARGLGHLLPNEADYFARYVLPRLLRAYTQQLSPYSQLT